MIKKLTLLVGLLLASAAPADAHKWYPQSCCSEMDCAPVTKVERAPELKGTWMTTEHGTVFVPDTFDAHHEIKDTPDGRKEKVYTIPPPEEENRLHVCMNNYASPPDPPDEIHLKENGKHLICVIREPQG